MAHPRKLAYTLAEILVSISLIGGISAGGYVVMKNVSGSSTEVKLQQDVRTVNSAIRMYLANGGKLPSDLTADEALVKVRRQSADLKKNAGLKGATIDPRLNLRYQSTGEAMVAGPRAYWNGDEQQFYVSSTGAQPGVKEFYIGALPPPLPLSLGANGQVIDPNLDDRQTYGSFASVDSWVWDYDNSGSTPRSTPTIIESGNGGVSSSGGATDANLIILAPPTFSLASGRYDLSWYPRSLTLSHAVSTPPNVADIYYIVTGGSWTRYEGPIEVSEPGITVTTKAVATDLDHYGDSGEAVASYTANQVTLDPGQNLKASYRYAELGGPLAPGSTSAVLAPVPRIYLANANDIPDIFEKDSVFQSYWSWDGSNPALASVGRYSGITSFAGGYPGDPMELKVATFGSNSSLTLKYVTLAKNTAIAVSSQVETASTSIAVTPLLSPLVTPGNGSLSGGEKIVMTPDVAGGQTPANARIFYRIDGQDPGEVNGEPASGATLYTGPFSLEANNAPTVRVVARVYPPTNYKKWFSTSPPATLNYYLPYAEENVYAVTGGNNQIYNINPSTGSNQLYNSTSIYALRAVALDSARARLYYIEDNSAVSANGWRVGYLDFLNQTHITLGNLRTGWQYNATQQPESLAFFNGGLYYIHANSDDLVQIALNQDATAITAIAKVADLRSNSIWSNVGDLAVDETGLMFFVDTSKRYHRFDLVSMSNYLELGTVTQDFKGLAFFQGRLFASYSANSIHRLAPTTGKSLSSIGTTPQRMFVDLASPSSATPVSVAKSMWSIDDQADGPHLIEFRNNYRSPLISVAVDYGVLREGGVEMRNDTRYGILSLAISKDGVAYFIRNSKLKNNVKFEERLLLKLNLASLRLGDPLDCTPVGDLTNGLRNMTGKLDPDDLVTGLSLAPSGELYGILREGERTAQDSADYLFKVNQSLAPNNGELTVVPVGRTTSAVGHASDCEDLVFSRDGRLFVLDGYDNELLEVNPVNGSVLSITSQNTGGYRGIAVDNTDSKVVASDVGDGTAADTFVQVNGGPANDEVFLNYRDRWGYSGIEAISFFQSPFLLLSTQLDLFAADGSKTIHGIDFATGQTVPVTDAPWPVRALAYDIIRREIFYLRGGSTAFTLGSFNRDTFVHKTYGDLRTYGLEYIPNELPDNLMYFGEYLWYMEPKTDNLVRLQIGTTSIVAQKKVASTLR